MTDSGKENEETHDDLVKRVRRLETQVATLQNEIEQLSDDTDQTSSTVSPSPPDQDASPDVLQSNTGEPSPSPDSSASVASEKHSSSASAEGSPPHSLAARIEAAIGMKWLGVIGALAVVFAVALAIRYAIHEDLIGYGTRITLGILTGLLLSGGGGYAMTRTNVNPWGAIVTGSGIAITYFSVYAAYAFPAYREAIGLPFPVILLGLTSIVVATVVGAVRLDASYMASEGLLFGYLTAFFARSLGVEALVYTGLITLGLVVVLHVRDWDALAVGGVCGSYLLYIPFLTASGSEAVSLGLLTAFLTGVFGCYLYTIVLQMQSQAHADIALTLNTVFYSVILSEDIVREWNPSYIPLVYLSVAFILAGIIVFENRFEFATTSRAERTVRSHVLSQSVVRNQNEDLSPPFVTAPFLCGLFLYIGVRYLSTFWSTITLLVLLPLGTGFAHATDRTEMTLATHLFGGLAVVSLGSATIQFGALDLTTLLAPAATYLFGAAALAAYLVAWLSKTSVRIPSTPAGTVYQWSGTIALSLIPLLELSGYLLSGVWAILALVLLLIGHQHSLRSLRLQSLALFDVTTVKVFIVDTQGLAPLPRILSFLVLGIILLIASYSYVSTNPPPSNSSR